MGGDTVAGPRRWIRAGSLLHVLVFCLMFVAVLVVVENIKNCLGILLLHLLGDVRSNQKTGPGLRKTGELARVIIESNMDDMRELGGIRDVGFLVRIFTFLQFAFRVFVLFFRLLGQRPQINWKANIEPSNVGSKAKRRCWRFLFLIHHSLLQEPIWKMFAAVIVEDRRCLLTTETQPWKIVTLSESRVLVTIIDLKSVLSIEFLHSLTPN